MSVRWRQKASSGEWRPNRGNYCSPVFCSFWSCGSVVVEIIYWMFSFVSPGCNTSCVAPWHCKIGLGDSSKWHMPKLTMEFLPCRFLVFFPPLVMCLSKHRGLQRHISGLKLSGNSSNVSVPCALSGIDCCTFQNVEFTHLCSILLYND